ncbi:alpha/beta-hydrolase [Hyaloscypha variabilis]
MSRVHRLLFFQHLLTDSQTTGNFYNFSNIPYAAPPVGNLRFTAPQAHPTPSPVPTNDGSRFAVCPNAIPAWTNVATQWLTEGIDTLNISAGYTPPTITSLPTPIYGTSEDCLLLDVLVPKAIFDNAGTGAGAPVLVWIHGGGYTLGWKTEYGTGGGLIRASNGGIIYVAINYRLGIFGFLGGPTFAVNGTANAGLLDQRFALEWIQSNIHLFGGDPTRVTVMGESAGGGSTIHQVTAYGGLLGKVPFSQAIIQSGAFLMVPTNNRPEDIFQKFLNFSGVTTLQQARGLSTSTLQLVNYKLVGEAPYGDFTFNPWVDGSFAPALPGELLARGQFDKSLKLLIGHNVDEGLYFTSPFVFTEATFRQNIITVSFPDSEIDGRQDYIANTLYPPVYDGTYGYTDPVIRGDYIVSEALFQCNAEYLAQAFGSSAWAYLFSVPPALHGDDIPYTFYEGPAAAVLNDTLALIMQAYWTNFVMNSNPNGAGLPNFPNFGATGQLLDLNQTFIVPIADDLAGSKARCNWWQKSLYY